MMPLLLVLICLATGLLAYRRQLRFLHLFQQEEYDNDRFLDWFKRELAVDYLASFILILCQISRNFGVNLTGLIMIAGLAYTEPDPTQQAKKTLNLTERAQRLLQLSLFLSFLPGALVVCIDSNWTALGMLFVMQSLPFTLMFANSLLQPYQEKLNQRFLEEAKEKLNHLHPKIIAITGSFGKTSTKHILHHALSSQFPTLTTPGSINTTLGISRIIREQLMPSHQYFVAEMGAYGPGSIAKLCQLAPPNFSAITAIGEAHYERFKNLETVAQAKFEIAQYTLSRGGKVVIAVDSMRDIHYAQDFIKQYRRDLILVTEERDEQDADYRITNKKQDKDGIHFQLVNILTEQTFDIHSPIYGLAQCSNVALSIVLANLAGISMENAIAAMASALQIPHRMQVLNLANGTTLIDNAYNSNPKGFACSLDLLSTLAGRERRRVLITPGIVELGEQHHSIHREIGEIAARHVDVLLLVNASRIPTFYKAFTESTLGRLNRIVIAVETLKEAQEWLEKNSTGSDVVLIENDLPDLYFKWKKR